MTKLEYLGQVKCGVLTISNVKRFKAELSQLKDMDVDIVIRKRGKASCAQSRYYWGVLVPEITERLVELGNDVTKELVHEFLKLEFNKKYLRDQDGTVIGEVGDTTTSQNKEQRSEYIERCIRFAAEKLEITISLPNTQTSFFTHD